MQSRKSDHGSPSGGPQQQQPQQDANTGSSGQGSSSALERMVSDRDSRSRHRPKDDERGGHPAGIRK